MSLPTFTLVHVLLSLLGIVSGCVVTGGLIAGRKLTGWACLFLATTIATSVTGFFFPFEKFLPSHAVGILSLVVLALALVARFVGRLAGKWRAIYVLSSVFALYLNTFVLVVQLFLRVPALHELAPAQNEPPFAVSQAIVLVLFVVVAIAAVRGFRNTATPPASG
jgi:hypothetical protein